MSHDSKVDRLRAFLACGEWDQLMIRDAILEAKLPSACKLTLSAIVSHHSSRRPCPTVGVRRLAALTSTKPDTVVTALRKPELMGLVEVSRANRTINTYDLTGTISGLLAYPLSGQLSQLREQNLYPQTGQQVSAPKAICPDRGNPSVPIGGWICPKRGNVWNQEGTK